MIKISRDEIKYSLKNLMSRKLRSWLTILSILIGITSIFALVSFGLGIKDYVDTMADEAGRDKLFILAKGAGAPGMDENFRFTRDDVDFVSKIKGVNDIMGLYFDVAEIEFKEQKKYSFIIGFDVSKQDFLDETFTVEVEKGRNLKKGELGKMILGYNYQFKEKIFKRAIEVGDKILLNGNQFEVVGFYEEVGNPQDDSQMYVTEEQMELLFPDIKDEFGYAIVRADKSENPRELADKIEDKLRKFKGEDEGKETFYVQTFDDFLATFGAIINIINGVLVLISLISLVVATVNIMNTMYTAVLERTNEIGVMKAIGAQNSSILFIFMFESGFLGMVGGILGVALGWLIAKTGGMIATASGYSMLKPIFPWYLTLGCIFFALLVGAAAGLLPAIQASKLKPVDALRYE